MQSLPCSGPDSPMLRARAPAAAQIEIFTWSASGAIITDAFAASFPTMVRSLGTGLRQPLLDGRRWQDMPVLLS